MLRRFSSRRNMATFSVCTGGGLALLGAREWGGCGGVGVVGGGCGRCRGGGGDGRCG